MTVYDRSGLPTPREEWFRFCRCSNGCPRCYGTTPQERSWNEGAAIVVRKLPPSRAFPYPDKETPWANASERVHDYFRR
jgi:hypothetical protein